jgi:hypothetical protein
VVSCPHQGPYVARACTHLLVPDHDSYIESFVGRGIESELLCRACSSSTDRADVVDVCSACERLARDSDLGGVLGAPEAIVAASTLALVHEELELVCPDLIDLQPVTGADRNLWIGLTADALVELDLDARTVRRICAADHGTELVVSAGARFAAIVQPRGTTGAVISLATGELTMALVRDGYQSEHCDFSIAFVEHDGKTLVCHARNWNRLDLYDAATGDELTPRVREEYDKDRRPEHYLDYFHCGLAVSPDQRRIADNGWVWHPVGEVVTWSIDAWLANVWESEDGESRKLLAWREYFWDGPLAWLDSTRLLVWGYGKDDEWLVPAVLVYDTVSGALERWFGGVPDGDFHVDRELHVLADGRLTIWDVARGARLLEAMTPTVRYHPDAKVFASLTTNHRITIGRVRGHHAAWNRGAIAELVRIGDPESLHVLGDALEAAGCNEADVLAHCRAPGPHRDRCWVFARLT